MPNKICRFCLVERKPSKLRDVFQRKLSIIIRVCLSIQIFKGDGLPSGICLNCFQTITRFCTFKRRIERNDKLLRNHLTNIKAKENNRDIAFTEPEILKENSDEAIKNEEGHDTNCLKSDISDLPEKPISHDIQENKLTHNVFALNEMVVQMTGSQDKNEQVLNRFDNSDIVNKTMNEEIKIENQLVECQNVLIGPPPLAPIHPNESIENKIFASLKRELPPLIPLKPIVDEVVSNKNNTKLSLECATCVEKFSSLSSLKEHKLLCSPSNSLTCNICRKEFKDRTKLIGHLKGHMISKDYICKICHKKYPNPSTLQIHIRTHTGERPYKCPVCNKGFTRWAGVVSHMQTHDDHRPFKCESCDKSFKIQSNLERHKVLHSGSLPFCCNYCGKTFSQSDNLQLHIRTYHTYEKPYLCSQCGKGFVSSARLNRHMWIHTGDKRFQCSSCSKAYSNSSDLRNHEVVTHGHGNKEKPFACHLCEKRFWHPCRLSKHLKTHQRSVGCSKCNKRSVSIEFPNRDICRHHNINKQF